MTLRVGFLGCGGIAKRHVAAMRALPDRFELVAGVGRDLARTQAFCAEQGGRAFLDMDAMIDAGIDLMIATLPPYTRGGEIERAAARGVHLLVEKPIALAMPEAEAMVTAVEAAGVTAAIGFMYRHGDAVKAWKAAETGPVGLYAGAYHCNALHAPWWREEAKSGGQILEQVIHQIDLIRHLMGEPDTVYARRADLFHGDVPGYDVEDVSAIVFGWNDGRIATLNASNIATPGVWHKEWNVFAEAMTGRFTSWGEARFLPVAGGEPVDVTEQTDPFVAQLADLADAIAEGREPLVPLREGARTLKLALAARESADTRREVALV